MAGTDGLEVRHVLVKSGSMEMSIEVVSSKTGLGVLGALLDPIYMPFLGNQIGPAFIAGA